MFSKISMAQFHSGWYLCTQKSPFASNPISEQFSQHPLWNSSNDNVSLTEDGPLSSFWRRTSNASFFHASHFKAISGVVFFDLCLQVVSQAPQYFRPSELQMIDVLGYVPAGSVSSSSTLQTFRDANHGYIFNSEHICLQSRKVTVYQQATLLTWIYFWFPRRSPLAGLQQKYLEEVEAF